jgi:hypothetical protein
MVNVRRSLGAAVLLPTLVAIPALAQQFQGYTGVFEGYAGNQALVRANGAEAHWLLDQYSRFSNGHPSPGDRVHVDVDTYGRAVNFVIEEHPARRSATVDHIEGPTIVVRTNYGIEAWNDVATTWHLGVAPGGLLPGDAIDVGVFRDRTLAYVRLDGRASMAPPPPAEFAPPAPPPEGMVPPVDEIPPDGGDGVQAQLAPPPLPVYDVPPCPEPDYIWTPGYWHWGPAGYYWVPGVWVAPPGVGLLWTPGYWGYGGGVYIFHAGYWGPHVGFYGGVVYGGGYYGEGFAGGRWEGGHVIYNTAAVSVNTTVIHNTYVSNTVVINNQTTTINSITSNPNRTVSFSGGPGGARATPTASEQAWASEAHVKPTPAQVQHIAAARSNPQLQHSFNQGRPPVLSAQRPMAPSPAAGGAPRAGAPAAGVAPRAGAPAVGVAPRAGEPAAGVPARAGQPGLPAQPQFRPEAGVQPRAETQARPPAPPPAPPRPAAGPEKRGEGKEREERR